MQIIDTLLSSFVAVLAHKTNVYMLTLDTDGEVCYFYLTIMCRPSIQLPLNTSSRIQCKIGCHILHSPYINYKHVKTKLFNPHSKPLPPMMQPASKDTKQTHRQQTINNNQKHIQDKTTNQ